MICQKCADAADRGDRKHYCESPPSCPCKHGGRKPWRLVKGTIVVDGVQTNPSGTISVQGP